MKVHNHFYSHISYFSPYPLCQKTSRNHEQPFMAIHVRYFSRWFATSIPIDRQSSRFFRYRNFIIQQFAHVFPGNMCLVHEKRMILFASFMPQRGQLLRAPEKHNFLYLFNIITIMRIFIKRTSLERDVFMVNLNNSPWDCTP